MDPSVLTELHRQLQSIKSFERGPLSSPMHYWSAWVVLFLGLFMLTYLAYWVHDTFPTRLLLLGSAIVIVVQSLWVIIQNTYRKRLGPIIEALLALQQEMHEPPGPPPRRKTRK